MKYLAPFKMRLNIILLLLLGLSLFNGKHIKAEIDYEKAINNDFGFIENKGQMVDQNGEVITNAYFKIQQGNTILYVTKWGLTYFFLNPQNQQEYLEKLYTSESQDLFSTYPIKWERIDMKLQDAKIERDNFLLEGESKDQNNYYYAHCPDGILDVHSYKKITVKNIYPNIDWVLYVNNDDSETNDRIKYDFVVHPNGDYRNIAWEYFGVESLSVEDKENVLFIEGATASIKDVGLRGFSEDRDVSILFKRRSRNSYGFDVTSEYNRTKPLIIDPTLIWSTYYGGTAVCCGATVNDEGGWGIESDGTNVYVTGNSNTSGLSMQNPGGGAYYDGTFNGGVGAGGDIVVFKFNTSGVRQWATFYGGSANDNGYDISLGASSVWITGYTASTNLPTFNPGGGAYFDNTRGGVSDAFILKFNTNGVRQWATYYGGTTDTEFGASISCDGSRVVVTGETRSTNFPTFNPGGGAYFDNTRGGTSDAFILKFNTNGVRQWATYYGGTGGDFGGGIWADGSNIWATGTAGASVPVQNPGGGAYYDAAANGTDGFILKFNNNGVRQWATHYGGTSSDEGLSIHSDGTNVFVAGRTSSTNLPVQNPGGGAYFDNTQGGGGDLFILKFNTNGVRQWGTYYGGSGNDGGISIIHGQQIVNDGTNVFVTGRTFSSNLPTLNPGGGAYFDNTLGGFGDGYLVQFSTAGVRQWATYIGGGGNDLSMGCHADGSNLWVTGIAANGFPTLNPGGGAYYDGTGNATSDIFISQFSASSCPCAMSGSGNAWTWNGCSSTDWFEPCNWDRQSIPVTTSDVTIPNTTNKPLINSGTANCNTLNIQSSSGALLNINSSGGAVLNITQ